MVAATSPFGLSKAALERRLNHQLPRKRHTPYPATKNPTNSSLRHIARPKPKSKPATSSSKLGKPRMPENNPEKRGTNRTHPTSVSNRGINPWSARRILASRPHPLKSSKTLYKVQWETTWENSSQINELVAAEWREAEKDGNTFSFKSQDGSEWTVLKDATGLENDSEESQWEMWRAIRRNVVKDLESDWHRWLRAGDFMFASEPEEVKVREILGGRWPEEDITANNVLRAAWTEVTNDPGLLDMGISLGNIKICFVGQIDPWIEPNQGSKLEGDPRLAYSVMELVKCLVPSPMEGLEDDAFSNSKAHENHSHYCKLLKSLMRKTPFMFRSGTWLQLFAFLLLGSETFRSELATVGIKVQDDWCQRAREYDMQMYYDRIVDSRSAHEIQETYLNLRDFFRELVPRQRSSSNASVVENARMAEPGDGVETAVPTDSTR